MHQVCTQKWFMSDGIFVSREAIRRAYDVLKAADNSGIKFQDFLLFMEEYQPEKGNFSVMNKYLIQLTDQVFTFWEMETLSFACKLGGTPENWVLP